MSKSIIQKLSPEAQALLRHLISLLPAAVPDNPTTFTTYRRVHKDMGLSMVGPTWGESLKTQGLVELALWAKAHNLPAITGLVVNEQTLTPGKGYFEIQDPQKSIYDWWKEQIENAKTFPWQAV